VEDQGLLKSLIRHLKASSWYGSALFPRHIETRTALWQAMSAAQVAEILRDPQEWNCLSFEYIGLAKEVLKKLEEVPELRDAVFLHTDQVTRVSLYHLAMGVGNLELIALLQNTYPHLHDEKLQDVSQSGTPVMHAIRKGQLDTAIAIIPELSSCRAILYDLMDFNPREQVIEAVVQAFTNSLDQHPDQWKEILTRVLFLGKPTVTQAVLNAIAPQIDALIRDEEALKDLNRHFPRLFAMIFAPLDRIGTQPIHREAANPNSLAFKALQDTYSIYSGVLFWDKDELGNTSVHIAAKSNNISVLKAMQKQKLLNPLFSRDFNGVAPLELAAKANHWEFVLEAFGILRTAPEAAHNLQRLADIKDKQGNTIFDLVSRMEEVPPHLAPRIDLISLLWKEMRDQQINELNHLERLLGEEQTVFPETTELPMLGGQIAESYRKIAAKRKEVWNRRADRFPIFLLPTESELSRAALTRWSFESGAASQPIPLADPTIDITQLLHYLDRIEGSLPATIRDEGVIRPREDVVVRLKKQITDLAQDSAVLDELNNALSETFKDQIRNILRHLVVSLNKQEAAVAEAPEGDKQVLQERFNKDLQEILWERLGLDFFHCHDRLATDCEDLYYERYATKSEFQNRIESQQLSNKILSKLFQFRRQLFHETVSRVDQDAHVAATHRYYRSVLGKEFGIGSTEMSQENAQYAGFRVMGQEERIRKEMKAALMPDKVAAYFAKVIEDPVDKDITPALVTEWIQEHYPESVDDFFLPDGSWNPMAIAILLQDLNILKRIGMDPPPSFGSKNLPPPVAGEPLSLEHRLQAFDHYVERAEESRNLEELGTTIIDLLNRWPELLGPILKEDEAKLLDAHRQLLDYVEGRWNRSAPEFQDTNLAQAPQFKPIFAGACTEKEALKRAIDDLKQRIDPLAAAEKRAREEVEAARRQQARLLAAEDEEKARGAQANQERQAALADELAGYIRDRETHHQNKQELNRLLKTITSPAVRHRFRLANQSEVLQKLKENIRDLIKQIS